MRKAVIRVCEQLRCRSACTAVQCDQHLCSVPIGGTISRLGPLDLTQAQHSLQPRHSMSTSAVCPGKLSWDLAYRDPTHGPWFTRRVALPLHHGGFLVSTCISVNFKTCL